MNSLASILYSSSSAKSKAKRKTLVSKPMASNASKCKTNGTLFRSSTPKTSLTRAVQPISSSASSDNGSTNASESPRCSTPVFAKQRRTRPFIACELCRQRAFQSLDDQENKLQTQPELHHHHSSHRRRSTIWFQQQNQSTMKTTRRRSSIAQLLVWIV